MTAGHEEGTAPGNLHYDLEADWSTARTGLALRKNWRHTGVVNVEDLAETAVHVYMGFRKGEKDALNSRYPPRLIDYVLFQTGTFDVLKMSHWPLRGVLDGIMALIQTIIRILDPKVISVCTISTVSGA